MKNNLKVIGFIAVVAVIAMGVIGCTPAPESVSIIEPALGFVVNERLEASPAGSTYKWYKGGALIPSASLIFYTPTEAGVYYVDVDGTESDRVTVFNVPTGTYTMTGTANGNWNAAGNHGQANAENETVIITKATNKYTFSLTNNHTTVETFTFDITKWTKLNSVPSSATGYAFGLKLAIDDAKQTPAASAGYIPSGVTNPKEIYFYVKSETDLSEFIRTRPGQSAEAYAPGGDSPSVVAARKYVKNP